MFSPRSSKIAPMNEYSCNCGLRKFRESVCASMEVGGTHSLFVSQSVLWAIVFVSTTTILCPSGLMCTRLFIYYSGVLNKGYGILSIGYVVCYSPTNNIFISWEGVVGGTHNCCILLMGTVFEEGWEPLHYIIMELKWCWIQR